MVTWGICWGFGFGDLAASVITKLAVSGLSPFRAKAYGVFPSYLGVNAIINLQRSKNSSYIIDAIEVCSRLQEEFEHLCLTARNIHRLIIIVNWCQNGDKQGMNNVNLVVFCLDRSLPILSSIMGWSVSIFVFCCDQPARDVCLEQPFSCVNVPITWEQSKHIFLIATRSIFMT